MGFFEELFAIWIVRIIIAIIAFISIVIIAINSIIISKRLKKIHYKLIDIDYNNKQDTEQIYSEIKKTNLSNENNSYEQETEYQSLFGSKRQ